MINPAGKKFLVIDGHSLLYRAFYALPPLVSRRGEHTGAVFGFTNMLFKLLEAEAPDYVAVAFDPPGPSFRAEIDPAYKAQREAMPQELAEQVARTNQILEAMQIPVFTVERYEADDVIGTLADHFSAKKMQVMVVTGDADLLQLASEKVTVMLTKKGISQMESYDEEGLLEAYGLTPQQFISFKALKGDPSDNIPGVPGIGEKTALNLLHQYGSIENIYQNLDKIKGRAGKNLEAYREELKTGLELVTLKRGLDLDLKGKDCLYREPDYEKLLALFGELGFNNLARRLQEAAGGVVSTSSENLEAKKLKGLKELKKMLDQAAEGDFLSLRFKTKEGRPHFAQPLLTLAFAFEKQSAYYCLPEEGAAKESAKIFKWLKELEERGLKFYVHDYKELCHLFLNENLAPPKKVFDTHLSAYLLETAAGRFTLPALLQRHLGLEVPEPQALKKEKATLETCALWLALEAENLAPLAEIFKTAMAEQKQESLYYDLELPLSKVLALIERCGLKVDAVYLKELSKEIKARLEELKKNILFLAGEDFNINSPQQLAVILFDKLKLPVIRKTKTGRSTDAAVLEELAQSHEIAALLLLYRQLAKLEGTYLTGLIDLIDPEEQKLFTSLNQVVTATGRLSSSDPNLQNIPIRLEEGRRIRKAFIPSSSKRVFFSADYSQIELRVLAHLSEDEILCEAFKKGEDVHRRTAAEVNAVAIEEVTPLMRENAKAVNFGIIYGSSDYGLAQNLKISRQAAKAYMDSYFARYQGVRAYMDDIVEKARLDGFVATLLNRRRYLPEIHSKNHNTRRFAERMALNSPIQGTAADIIKLAMIKIGRIIEEGGFEAAMLLQIHDELLFEIEETELDFFAPLIKKEMEEAFKLAVPLKVDLKWGRNWEELTNL